ncbi:MAG: ADP-ribosylglycohydrolase family protein [Gammaproteobacteria bacterium]|nr:ADP-ribosylglycohydrolase family protein [Gammaproteobacteria bacterium]
MTKVYASRIIGPAEIQVVIGDIAEQSDMDAVVNAANPNLLNGSGVSGAIFRAAGAQKLAQACRELAPINVGDAVITPGFSLPNPHIIHCCGPRFNKDPDAEEKLAACYWNILSLADKSQIHSLAIPAISTGEYGFPIEEATRICINVIKATGSEFEKFTTIRFVVCDEKTAAIYARHLLETISLPENAFRFFFDARFSPEQSQRIRKGFIGDQDYKWFFYFEDPWLYVFRGCRTLGRCVWFLKLQSADAGYKVSEAWVDDEFFQWFPSWRGNTRPDNFLHELISGYLGIHGFLLRASSQLTDKFEFTPLDEDSSCSYCVLPDGRVKVALSPYPFSGNEVRNLGLRLIELADEMIARQPPEKVLTQSERFRGALLGLACGDAVGTTVEFMARGSFPLVTDMVGGGPFKLKPGEWTDDTSMALCLAESLVVCNGFDAADQMRRYVKWLDDGYWSSNGRCFDIGGTTHEALSNFKHTGNPFSGSTHPQSAGNGCIMRLAPVPMFFYPDREAVIEMSGESSRTTHGAAECVEAIRLFGAMLFMALNGACKEEILLEHGMSDFASRGIQAIANGKYREKPESEIFGIGYVVPSLEAALWCFYHTENFKDAILKAANLGKDADTTAAICGQIAGAYYGESDIPRAWREKVVLHDQICALADKLHQQLVE